MNTNIIKRKRFWLSVFISVLVGGLGIAVLRKNGLPDDAASSLGKFLIYSSGWIVAWGVYDR